MRQYQVPQFITVEDKVLGPFTLKQAIYVGIGAGIVILAFMFLNFALFFLVALITAGATAAMAFLKINEQPLPLVVKNAVFYFLRPNLYVWKKGAGVKPVSKESKKPETTVKTIPKLEASKLSELAWSLDIKSKTAEEESQRF